MKTLYHARKALEDAFSFAQATRAGNLLFISGCLSWDENGEPLGAGDMGTQVSNVYQELRDILAAHGATFDHVVKETVFTTDMDALVGVAHIRADLLRGYAAPAATWVEVKRLVKPEFLLEVEMTAVLPQ